MGLSREQIDQWPVTEAGFTRRVVLALHAAGIANVGQLRARLGTRIPRCGKSAARNIAWFFERADLNISGTSQPADLRAWLDEFLTTSEVFVVAQRYGLDDPLFRLQMKRQTLREIAEARGSQTRERVRQVLQRALGKLSSRLAQATAEPLLAAYRQRFEAGVVTSAELGSWRGAAWLGGCQPWGALLLLSEVSDVLVHRHDYFSTLSAALLEPLERRLFGVLEKATKPLSPKEIDGDVPARVVSVVLDRHPCVDATRDGRFFLFPRGAAPLLAGLATEEVVSGYNKQVAAHSRREPAELARVQ